MLNKRLYIFAITAALTLVAVSHNHKALAGCSDIEDLDKRAECYEDKIEDKQEDYDSTSKKLSEVRSKKDNIQTKISGYLKELSVTTEQINELQGEINDVKKDLDKINELLADRKGKLAEKVGLRNKIIRDYAKRTPTKGLDIFMLQKPKGTDLSGFQYTSFNYIFNKTLSDETLKLIKLLNTEIDTYEKDKQEAQELKNELETTQNNLLSLKANIDAAKLAAENEKKNLENKEQSYVKELADLQKEIDSLTAKQQEILNQKGGDSIVSGYTPASYKLPDPPFKPAFAAMSYGAYTHRNGMSQYGAKGRAQDGYNYKEILNYYYKASVKTKNDFPDKISVQGYGEIDYQKYLYGIAEMPSDWPMDALKAQAIAARTYAYGAKKPICTTQSCQVFLKSKAGNPPERWKQAVDETKNMVMEGHTTAQYSSTTGGYLNQTGWDKKGNWPGDAYEKRAGSPWFYKAWYTQSYTDNSSTCGRATPWLKESEMADILNAWVVWCNGTSSEKDHISPITTSCWGGDPYSIDEMREKADKYGNAYSKISSVSVEISNSGYTKTVKFNTDQGNISIDGSEFMTVFNLRAPGYVSIRGVVNNRALFDIEMEN